MQKEGFWVGFIRYEINKDIQQNENENEDGMNETEHIELNKERLNNKIRAKLMSISYNLLQFINDSILFNKIVYDIFKYCKINEQNRRIVVDMLESVIQRENLTYLKLDKDFLLSADKSFSNEEKLEEKNIINENV